MTTERKKERIICAYLGVMATGLISMSGLAMMVLPFSNTALLGLWYWLPSHLPMWLVYPLESFILGPMCYVGAIIFGFSIPLLVFQFLITSQGRL